MSWLSNAFKSIGNVAKKVTGAVGGAVKKVATVAKAAVVPLASFAAGLVPGVGPLLSGAVDALGNKLMGGTAEAAQEEASSPTEMLLQTTDSATLNLGSSPAAMALTSATTTEKKGFLGIGDGQPGVFGIGDSKPGVFGIGTGVNKEKKAAAEAARAQAEDAAKGEGLTPKLVKLAGETAAAKAEQKVQDKYDKPAGTGETSFLPWLIGAGLVLLGL